MSQRLNEWRERINCGANRSQAAFTLVEIMIVVAVIGLLAALAMPNMAKARKQAQGRRILNDVRQLDAAITQWALESGSPEGGAIDTNGAAVYLKIVWPTRDILGNIYNLTVIGPTQVTISANTKTSLAGAGIDWGPY